MSVPVLTHRRDLRQGDLVFPEEILRIGHTLDFQLGCVSKEVQQEGFGPELDTSSLCDWLNLHTAYDFALQDVVDHIEITLCRNFGEEEHPFTYPLNRAERDVLRGEMEACCQLRTGRTLAQHYNHLLVQEEVEPPELTAGTRRIPVDKVSFADELSECGGLLQFYMPVAFAPDAVFGTHVATAENDGWLNVYRALHWMLSWCAGTAASSPSGIRWPSRSRPRCWKRWTPTAGSRPVWRWRISGPGTWWRNRSPARLPVWPSCEHAVGPVCALCAGFRRRAGQGPAQAGNRPVGASFAPVWGVRF